MEYIGKFVNNCKEYYNSINAATLTGAIDVVIVQQEDGTFLSSPFHVRFGKLGVLRSREKIVDIEINGDAVEIHMKLGESGEAFFVSESTAEVPAYLATSPIPTVALEDMYRSSMDKDGESKHDTLMGNRGDGMFTPNVTVEQIMGQGQGTMFKAETVNSGQMDLPFQPIDPDNQMEVEVAGQDATEEDRKRGKKKSRKRRKKRTQELSKISSEFSINDPDNDDDQDDMQTDSTPPESEHLKLGHRKSHSFAGIQVEVNPHPHRPSDSGELESWVNKGIKSRSIGPEFHFFSDTEIEVRSPTGSRPPTPVHSDTEYEVGIQRQNASSNQSEDTSPHQSWPWGELPSPPVTRASPPKSVVRTSRDASPSNVKDGISVKPNESSSRLDNSGRPAQTPEEVHRSMLSHMFSFMRQTKKIRSQVAGGGIYLDDLNVDSLDPELAALYITQSSFHHKLQSSNETNYTDRSRDEDTESGRGQSLPQSPHSLSARAMHQTGGPRSVDSDFEDSRHDYRYPPDVSLSLCGSCSDLPDPPEEMFLQSLVTYDDFVENPRLIENPDLVVKIGNKYYTWQAACPIIMSWALYQRVLPQSVVDTLAQEYSLKRQEEKKKNETPPTRSYSWLTPWRSRQSEPVKKTTSSLPETADSTTNTDPQIADAAIQHQVEMPPSHGPIAEVHNTGTSSDNESDSTQPDGSSKKLPLDKRTYYESPYCKTLRLTSDQIAQLHLREGPNEAVFSVTTAFQGTTRCKCHIYLWRYDDRVVISDIDGTITKSDVLGHILPIVGQDWAQSGVAQLFTKIKNNGYRILYLSARAIGQAHITREYLRSVRQGDLSLPDGPLLLNPTSLLSALHREVIEKKPEEFKISCLRDIQCLFPSQTNPFYAGYGNRVNDVWAYRAVGIPISRIFTINPRGELKLELTQSFQSSYSKQSFIVDLVFPPFTNGAQREVLEGTDFNEFTFWREPVPELPDEASKFITTYSDSSASRKRHASSVNKK